jgi:acylphosphatase
VTAQAIRAVIGGDAVDAALRDAIAVRARDLGVLGWVRIDEDGALRVHVEGARPGIEELMAFAAGDGTRRTVAFEPAKVEGHEQFGIRGVPAGQFAVLKTARGYALRLEVDGAPRTWALAREPSLNPADKRLAVEAAAAEGEPWDAGLYEQGGRVPWPEALERGHAVFVLHGERLRGGFALQRTRPGQWLLIKRREPPLSPPSRAG